MQFTKKTKLYESKAENVRVIFRTLTVTEISVINSIKSDFHKKETAFQLGYVSGEIPNFSIQQQIGADIMEASTLEISNTDYFELTVDQLREEVNTDNTYDLISTILSVMPQTSIEYLVNLTYVDLMELVVLCEKMTNKKIFTVGKKTQNDSGVQIKDEHTFFEEDGMSLQEKMKEQKGFD